jgi:hypothetical protein
MASTTLSLKILEEDLTLAEQELAKATANRLRVHELENQWITEVTSLRNLIEVRRKRLDPDGVTPEVGGAPRERIRVIPSTEAFPRQVSIAVGELSHIDWIADAIQASGNAGMKPPEIFKKAESAGRQMHRNYPYTALRELLEQKRISRRGDRYYAP